MSRANIQKRRQTRFLLTQALYQWQLSDANPHEILLYFQANPQFKKADMDYFEILFDNITRDSESIDALYQPHLDRSLQSVDPIEQSILRLATYELKNSFELAYKIIINEAVELAKIFGATDSYKYINTVLDKTAKILRPFEEPSGKEI